MLLVHVVAPGDVRIGLAQGFGITRGGLQDHDRLPRNAVISMNTLPPTLKTSQSGPNGCSSAVAGSPPAHSCAVPCNALPSILADATRPGGPGADVVAAVCLVLGALLTLVAAIGILRFPDVLTRMHSATKPQVLGLLVVLVGLGLRLRDPRTIGLLALVALFQLVTSPIASHMVGRASFRAGQVRRDLLVVDELSDVLASRERPTDGS